MSPLCPFVRPFVRRNCQRDILAAWAGENKAEQQLRLALDLVDGSHIIGIPNIDSVPVQTSYAKMDIPLKQIRTIRIEENHETASFDLLTGDKIKGVISLEPIKLETVFGKVSVSLEHAICTNCSSVQLVEPISSRPSRSM